MNINETSNRTNGLRKCLWSEFQDINFSGQQDNNEIALMSFHLNMRLPHLRLH